MTAWVLRAGPMGEKTRVWEAEQVLDQLFHVFELLPEVTKRLTPLNRAWVLDMEDIDG